MAEYNDEFVLNICDRLRKLRKRLNLNIEDVAESCGLTFNQIQRLEVEIRAQKIVKNGANGTVSTILILLNYYAQKVSLDLLFDLNIPVMDIPLKKVSSNEISRSKMLSLIHELKDIAEYM